MNRINQVQKLTAAVAVVFLAGALTGCDSSTSKKIAENTEDPFTAVLEKRAQQRQQQAQAAKDTVAGERHQPRTDTKQ